MRFFFNQEGQTLIETVVAIFMLTMGITAAVGLANYALSNSTLITKQIIAVGLAREGVEAVKNMRDSNWLQQTSIDTNCYDFASGNNTAKCYSNWLTSKFDIRGSFTSHNRIAFNTPNSAGPYISIDNVNPGMGNADQYGVNFNGATSSPSFAGFFVQPGNGNGVFDGAPDPAGTRYYRDVQITQITTPPYDKTNLQKLFVQSQVWWTDRKCPPAHNYATAPTSCKLELDLYMSNWKNY